MQVGLPLADDETRTHSVVCSRKTEFEEAQCLMNAEVAQYLEKKLSNRAPQAPQKDANIKKAYEYVNRVKMFRDAESINRVRNELEKRDYHPFESAQVLLPIFAK